MKRFEPFLPNVIKFYPFPEFVPSISPIALSKAEPWHPGPSVRVLMSDPSFARDETLIYVHVPYCDFFCHFCPLYKTTNRADYSLPEQTRTVRALITELKTYARHIAPGRTIRGIYFGGGTPTALPMSCLAEIVRCIKDEFRLSAHLEISIEGIPPHFCDPRRLEALIAMGVNRISTGVQSLQPEIREHLGRRDRLEDCLRVVDTAHQAGMSHVNVDVMYGYPDQTVEQFLKDVYTIRTLSPDSVDFYYMQIMGTPYRHLIAKHRLGKGTDGVPLIEMRERLLEEMEDWYQVAAECFDRHSPTPPCIWSHTFGGESGVAEIIAVGPSSYGQVAGYYYYNKLKLADYLGAVEDGWLPLRGRVQLTGHNLAIRLLFGSILTGQIPFRYMHFFQKSIRDRIETWMLRGLLERGLDSYKLTREGQVRFQMMEAECVPPFRALVMMRRYMLTFSEQRQLLFRRTELLYARSILAMVKGSHKSLGWLRATTYWLLLRLPDQLLDSLVDAIQKGIVLKTRWQSPGSQYKRLDCRTQAKS